MPKPAMDAQTILIVEDESLIARELEARLRKLGYHVQGIAASGPEALGLIAQARPDLVLMDVVLAGDMDGIETAAAIRQRWAIPVIYLTAYTDEATLLRAKATKPYGYIVKPYSAPELRANLEMGLYRHHSETRLLAAMDRDSADERLTSLEAACANDPAWRRWFGTLLATLMEAGTIVAQTEQPTVPANSVRPRKPEGLVVPTPPGPGTAPSEKSACLFRLDHYQVVSILGKGAMGLVFKGFDEVLQRVVAIKMMAPHLASCPDARRKFLHEARAMAAIRNDHIIDVYVVEEHKAVPFLVMEFVAGVSLHQKLRKGQPLGLEEIVSVAHQTACGLEAAHARGLIHRDIKPSNILLEEAHQRVKITDFGLACVLEEARQVVLGTVSGTPGFMAPEQARGEPLDHRSDLFSLGSVLYAMCTGHSPFPGGSSSTLRQVCHDTPQPIGQLNPVVPDWLVAIVSRLHAKAPEQRFQSAAELGAALRPYLP
jgi:CheY-like chemotaxis protein